MTGIHTQEEEMFSSFVFMLVDFFTIQKLR